MKKPRDIARQLIINAASTELEQAKASAVLTSIGDGAITTDEKGRVQFVNHAALEILGFKKRELMGKWFPKAVVAEDEEGNEVATIDRPIAKVFLTGEPITAKLFYRKKNGSSLPVMVTVSPIMLDGKPVGAVEVFRDFSREYEIDKMKSEFISLASHQLRTPLSAIHMYTSMLADGYGGKLNDKQLAYTNTVLASSKRMNELINTLLNIASIEGGGIAISSKVTNLPKLVRSIYKECKPLADEKDISIDMRLTPLPSIFTDPVLVKEVYVNLLTNAIKYTPKKGKIKATLEKKSDEVIFSVKDSGPGIPEDEHDRIFTKFYRASNITRHEATGTGLGLYMAQGVAKNLGGKIWFKSVEGKGATFYFSLPVRVFDVPKESPLYHTHTDRSPTE